MATTLKICIRVLLLLGFLERSHASFAQPTDLDPAKWANEMSKKGHSVVDAITQLNLSLIQLDSVEAFRFL